MLPDPLHPAMVHFPIALTAIIPLFVIGALVAIRRGAPPLKAWGLVVALMALLASSAILTAETGHDAEEEVEDFVDEDPIHEHEERADNLRNLAIVTVLVSAVGLAGGKVGAAGRGLGSALSVVLLVMSYGVGKSGGELVYEHGAANAYLEDAVPLVDDDDTVADSVAAATGADTTAVEPGGDRDPD